MSKFPAHERRIVRTISIARAAAGLSRRALSLKMKEAESYISRIERMQRNVSAAELTKIAETLDLDPVEFFRKTLR